MKLFPHFPSLPHLEHRSRFIRVLPFMVLCLSLSITLFGWHTVSTNNRQKAHQIYTDATEDIVDHITRRLHDQSELLQGGVGLFTVKPGVTRGDWRGYVAALQLDQYHPGILGIGYSTVLTPGEKETNEQEIRAEGFPGYSIRPTGKRPFYTSIIYIEPFTWRNQRAFGFDMFSEPLRRAAMEQARDKGITTIAAPITLVQETEVNKQRGMLMYTPVYHRGMAVDSVADRQLALKGFVYSPIRMNDFVYGSLGKLPPDIAFEIHAGTTSTSNGKMFSSLESERITLPSGYRSLFSSSRTIEAFGRTWLFTFRTLPSYDVTYSAEQSPVALIGGGFFVSLLLSLVAFMLLATRNKALALAREMTQELRNNERTIQASREHFQALVTTSPVGVFETDAHGEYLMVNEQWLRITGLNATQARGRGWIDSLHPEDRDKVVAEWRSAMAEQRPFRMENRHLTPDGVEFWVLAQASAMTDETGAVAGYIGTLTDITGLKRTEQELQESNQRFSTIFHRSPIAICLSYLKSGEFTDVNETFLQLFGYERHEIIGKTSLELGLWTDREERADLLKTLHDQGRVHQVERTYHHKSGVKGHLLVSMELVRLSGKQYMLGMLTDITPRKNAELVLAGINEDLESLVNERTAALSTVNAQLLQEIEERKKIEEEMLDHQRLLQAMSLELAMAEERERDRIAGELHDQVGQRLILAKMKLDALTSCLEAHPLEQTAADVVTLLEQSIQDTRSLTFQIRPPLLASAGLEATVQWLGEELNLNYGLRMLFSADNAPKPLPYEIRSTLFQAVRELLLNVARHADTDQVRVRMNRDEAHLFITIEDDGIGFDPLEAHSRKARTGGFGLFNIQQRIEYLGGTLVIFSRPGVGTRATISILLEEPANTGEGHIC
jgi:PAS domain S-box-containing protein